MVVGYLLFKDLVEKTFALNANSSNFVDIWQAKLRSFRRLENSWGAKFEATIRRQKKRN
jgi:hypothetical protein